MNDYYSFVMFKNKIILITGGTGSFGNRILKRLKAEIAKTRIFDFFMIFRSLKVTIRGSKKVLKKVIFLADSFLRKKHIKFIKNL